MFPYFSPPSYPLLRHAQGTFSSERRVLRDKSCRSPVHHCNTVFITADLIRPPNWLYVVLVLLRWPCPMHSLHVHLIQTFNSAPVICGLITLHLSGLRLNPEYEMPQSIDTIQLVHLFLWVCSTPLLTTRVRRFVAFCTFTTFTSAAGVLYPFCGVLPSTTLTVASS